jgi:hypothetical protein
MVMVQPPVEKIGFLPLCRGHFAASGVKRLASLAS